MSEWYDEHKSYGSPAADTTGSSNATRELIGLFERADMVRAVLLWEVVRSVEEHALIKKLVAAESRGAAVAKATLGAKVSALVLPTSQVKQQTLASELAEGVERLNVEGFNVRGWLEDEPHTDLLSLLNTFKDGKTTEGKMTQDISDYLDTKTSLDLDTWLARETIRPAHEKGKHDNKKRNFVGKWIDGHASQNLGSWLQSFTRTSSAFRADANARLAKRVMVQDQIALHQHAKRDRASSTSLQELQGMSYNKSGDPNSANFDFETWWAELGQNQSGVAGSNWTKLLPEPEAGLITASDSVGSGACCCGFACEQISNECCGAWYAAGGGESYMHYGTFKQHPKSIAALSARAESAQRQQRSTSALKQKARIISLAEVKTSPLSVFKPLNAKADIVAATMSMSMSAPKKVTKARGKKVRKGGHLAAAIKPATSKLAAAANTLGATVSEAFGDRGFLGWMCTTDACTSAPVRVGATCEVECLSIDGVDCMQPASSCLDEASKSAQDALYVQCGAKMAKDAGTDGYADPSHWCYCAKKKLSAQIDACRGDQSRQGGNKGAVFADGLKFGAGVSFASGDTFGDHEMFGARDIFDSLQHFGSTFLHTRAHTHTPTHTYTNTHTQMYTYACKRTHIHTQSHTHTHTHTHTRSAHLPSPVLVSCVSSSVNRR